MKLLLCIFALVATAMSDTDLEATLKSANDQFTANMFQEVVKNNEDKSVVLSAYSVLSPLAQLALASEGASHDEILKAIGFPNDNVTKAIFADATKRIRAIKGVELKEANKVYVRDGLQLNDEFSALSKEIFNSEVQNINFSEKKKAADEINAWVEDHTNKRIKDLVQENSIVDGTAAILVNAIYFKGKWKNPFKVEQTKDRDFHITKDKTISIPMMYQSDDFKYGESDELDAKILEMAYEGDETSLVVVLPNKIDGVNELVGKLRDSAALNKAIENLSSQEVQVTLPKFKIETTTDLKEVLTKMNVDKLFTPHQAQLTHLLKGIDQDLYISSATQKAFIEVNEVGAEAAAANHFNAITRSGKHVLHYVQFKADKPFYYALKQNDIVLFNGVFRS